MEKTLTKKDFPRWVAKLKSFQLFAPQKEENVWNYKELKSSESIDLDYLNTTIPPKKIIFPQREIFLEFTNSPEEGIQVKETLPGEKATAIFGVRPCDGKALVLMDKVFGGEFDDLYYWERRKATTLVGLTCNNPPSPNCFCLSVNGSPHLKEGLDILMTEINDKYFIESLTDKGNKLINEAKELFKEPKTEDKEKAKKIQVEAEKKIKRHVKEIKKVPEKLKGMFDSPFWDEESLSCIRCGICTYLCPTCHCFDINDEITSTSPLKGQRVRTWDNCQFPDFTMHSSGHNPRPDKASRLRQRVMHKFKYFVELYKNFQCIGCGRCISMCPVGIDIIEVVNKVKDYES